MRKKRKWQAPLILCVILITVYNVLPTLFFYTKPLQKEITATQADSIAEQIVQRVDATQEDCLSWLHSFCQLLHTKPVTIQTDPESPRTLCVTFSKQEDADRFRHYLPRAGSLTPNLAMKLSLYQDSSSSSSKIVKVQRTIGTHLGQIDKSSLFQFSPKHEANGTPTSLYEALTLDRAMRLAIASGGASYSTKLAETLLSIDDKSLQEEIALALSENLVSFVGVFGDSSALAQRFFSTFLQVSKEDRLRTIDTLENTYSSYADQFQALTEKKHSLDSQDQQTQALLSARMQLLDSALTIFKKHILSIKPLEPWTLGTVAFANPDSQRNYTLPLEGRNPFIEAITVDFITDTLSLHLYADLEEKEAAKQFIFNTIASLARQTEETIVPTDTNQCTITLSSLPNSKSILVCKLSLLAESQLKDTLSLLQNNWDPQHPDLQLSNCPIVDYSTYRTLPAEQKKLCLVLYAPCLENTPPLTGFRTQSVYLLAKGWDAIVKKVSEDPSSENSKLFFQDFHALRQMLAKLGYSGYEGIHLHAGKEWNKDFVFEAPDYFHTTLLASRENFLAKGSKRFATLELSTVEQRILTQNKIEDTIHEELLKWRDDYHAASLQLKGFSFLDIPKPTKSAFMQNILLSARKYFRGDDRKVLHWGLDLSGGKTVQIELRDANQKVVTKDTDLKQGISELYNRVNKMGVSEVNIRQEGTLITLDFPGSQSLSASELVKASSMFFHVVNEKFSSQNPTIGGAVERFLQEVWNEAVVTNKTTPEEVHTIACRHLYGQDLAIDTATPRSETASILYKEGLRLSLPGSEGASTLFQDTFSKVATFRGKDPSTWQGQNHPLLIVFKNFALEGSQLENVYSGYDPSKGNFLAFGVKGSYTTKAGVKIDPRSSFAAWTTPFSKEKVVGTDKGPLSHNHGWRMAVLLNDAIVSCPTLDSPLKESAMITGNFSQREISQLEADLKAGSLSFSPKILSEKNVSPELGQQERSLGIWATLLALIFVIGVMTSYYRFGGVVASIAVIFNILLLWATLQNMQATITLSSLAGLILTVGMAVDANVLVFERIREELSATGSLSAAVHAGYKKAFSAILDSNITTVIAALILLQFDSGPIKGFAVTLIIGIISSMFTALFMTRVFFEKWVQNPKHQTLSMLNLFHAKKFNFLRFGKSAFIAAGIVITLGLSLTIAEKNSLLGMDFTGGYSFQLNLTPEATGRSYRTEVEKALLQTGLSAQEIQVRELASPSNLKVFLHKNIAKNALPTSSPIDTVLQVLQSAHIPLAKEAKTQAEANWSQISGQMSDAMRNAAILGLTIALLAIFVYIAIRFEFVYAISATICLLHDLLFTVATIAILHAFGVPIQLDLTTIAALMTIAGYSLNDTIIVFDRIREEEHYAGKKNLFSLINQALNVTLSRTMLTSGTTLVVLLPLIFMGGSTIFGFTLVMAIGVIIGTLSSLFIAAPCLLFFQKKETPIKQRIALNS